MLHLSTETPVCFNKLFLSFLVLHRSEYLICIKKVSCFQSELILTYPSKHQPHKLNQKASMEILPVENDYIF